MHNKFKMHNPLVIEHYRKGVKIAEYKIENDVTNVGKNAIFDAFFNEASQVAQADWAIGLVNNSGWTAFAAADTMSSHAGWTEWTSYDEATRQAWGPGAASGQAVTNATAATFTISASGTLKGLFITSSNTKGGTAGLLWATAAFTSTVAVEDNDELKVTYTVSA